MYPGYITTKNINTHNENGYSFGFLSQFQATILVFKSVAMYKIQRNDYKIYI